MLSRETENRLRISRPAPSPVEIEATRKAVRDGYDMLSREGALNPELKHVIWRLMQEAAKTEGVLGDRERAWLAAHGRSAWPEIARPSEDNRQVEWEREMGFIQGTMDKVRTPMPRVAIYRANHERMLTVLGWLRYMRAKSFDRFVRDREVILRLARGETRGRIRVSLFRRDASDSAIDWVKHKMLLDVGVALNKMLTKAATDYSRVAP